MNATPYNRTPLFPLGQVVATPGALDALTTSAVPADVLLRRHHSGDWGVVDAEDWQANDEAAKDGGRILSAYILPGTGVKLWIITEADRSVTTFLLPDEY